jgi:hypothetical protein
MAVPQTIDFAPQSLFPTISQEVLLKLQVRISRETGNSVESTDRWPMARLLKLDSMLAEADASQNA